MSDATRAGNRVNDGVVEEWILGSLWPPVEKPKPIKRMGAKTTRPSFIKRNNQKVLRKTHLPGNDQVVYIIQCQLCGKCYSANGSDIFQRRCPACGGGREGLPINFA